MQLLAIFHAQSHFLIVGSNWFLGLLAGNIRNNLKIFAHWRNLCVHSHEHDFRLTNRLFSRIVFIFDSGRMLFEYPSNYDHDSCKMINQVSF
jgi:hypothetical protein